MFIVHVVYTLFATILSLCTAVDASWVMGIPNFITTAERVDPIMSPGAVSAHAHSVVGGSNFGFEANTSLLRDSECTSTTIEEDKSNYWFPHMYFQWANGSFTMVSASAVIYYLFPDDPGNTTAFPDNFKMISGDPDLRTYNASSYAQQAITMKCLNGGTVPQYPYIPDPSTCTGGIRAQVNFPSCWDGVHADSEDHKSHVAFPSEGPDSGTCNDTNYPVPIPRIFLEVVFQTEAFASVADQAMNSTQPFVFSNGDPTGYGYHADFVNGWDEGVLQKAIEGCNCNPYGDNACCGDAGIYTIKNWTDTCYISNLVDEDNTGPLAQLPGANPVQGAGTEAKNYTDSTTPATYSSITVYISTSPILYASTTTTTTPTAATASTSSMAAPLSSAGVASSTTRAASVSAVVGPSNTAPSSTPSPSASGTVLTTSAVVTAAGATVTMTNEATVTVTETDEATVTVTDATTVTDTMSSTPPSSSTSPASSSTAVPASARKRASRQHRRAASWRAHAHHDSSHAL
ncbi:hypothetical protein FISHEDRAFT_69766 [Fistulina hepatica ATCC 64428]|uniref:DUF1996 domain-containing protein n=1 Tax=Fistulina hepatica ATCC 64428 TaxID=1128425 RepID=A0A0D7AMJ7_9AGAR|nr:hypothetical protein FISHEDRAFT_69766 [Fistulina hepatica ATCC 64428]